MTELKSELLKARSSNSTKHDQSSLKSKLNFTSGVAVHPHPDPLTGLDLTLAEKCPKGLGFKECNKFFKKTLT